MHNEIDQAFEKLMSIKSEFFAAISERPNESDTRLKIIDRLLFEVLGWKRDSVFTEPYVASKGYIDYLLTIGERRGAIVIEAKRVGLLEPETKSVEMSYVSLSGPVVRPMIDGVRQALAYAMDKGVALAAVTDGEVWLFFKASRTDGKPPLEGKGILFPKFESIVNNFARYMELISPGAAIDRRNIAHMNSAEGLIVEGSEQQFCVFNPEEARMKTRDPLANDAALLFSQFFSRLSDEQDREMLRDCFVETNESRKADLELQKIIQKVLNNIQQINTGHGGALQAEIERAITSQKSETVLLIGNKGSGKSTFIDRFFNHVLPLGIRDKCVVANVDLANYHGDPAGTVSWMLRQLRGVLEAGVCASDPPSYDELQGIFFKEYLRWINGSRKPLYERDKEAFKIEFGNHMEARRENNPDEYVRMLLDWASRGQSRLPCLVFDNTDQFPIEIQDSVYQLAHSLESAAPVFNIVPITDRTVWRLSKAGALQSYNARNFYLPVPDAKEIISRRVDFLKLKLKSEPKAAKSYFSRKGFLVEINDLAMLAEAVGKVFVENDYVSGLIGRLGNFDIRRMLKLAERIFLSPEIKIDDIIRSKFGGKGVTTDQYRTHRALIKGEYDRFSESENEFISNLFYTNHRKPESPLLAFYVLWVLRQRMNSIRDDNVEYRHWLVSELCDFFESCGVSEDLVLQCLRRLYDRRLVEALDPNIKQIGSSDKIAIKDSGVAHIDLMLNSTVYVEQMSLVTGINEISTRDEIRKRVHSRAFLEARDIFVRYVLKIDASRVSPPSNPIYEQIVEARRRVKALTSTEHTYRRQTPSDRPARPRRGPPTQSRSRRT
ncbi:ATP-binding protein [Inquilinus limosus]|uniref:ATP-binding protein n=1 Tax=Inquilinus limosus TaxID=171674 RepID=UPI0009DE6C5C|nr:ATP-binding protein [Inquilinus limosus]